MWGSIGWAYSMVWTYKVNGSLPFNTTVSRAQLSGTGLTDWRSGRGKFTAVIIFEDIDMVKTGNGALPLPNLLCSYLQLLPLQCSFVF